MRDQYQVIATGEEATTTSKTNWKRRALIGAFVTICALALAAVTLFRPQSAYQHGNIEAFPAGNMRFAPEQLANMRARASLDNVHPVNSFPMASQQRFGLPATAHMNSFYGYKSPMAPFAPVVPTGRIPVRAGEAISPELLARMSVAKYYRSYIPSVSPPLAFNPGKPVGAFARIHNVDNTRFSPLDQLH